MNVLGVDQSLAKSGLVLVSVGERPTIRYKAVLESPVAVEGTALALQRAEELAGLFHSILANIDGLDHVIHETPPSANKVQRPESSLLSALALRLAAKDLGIPCIMVHANSAKYHFTGSGVAKKPMVRERMWKAYPELKAHRLTLDQSDALALVISHHYPELAIRKRPA